jgi:hypothetical protein
VTSKIIAQFPAYTVIESKEDHIWNDGDQFAVPYESRYHGTMYRMYTLGSTENYYRKSFSNYTDEQIAELVSREIKKGEPLYWAYANATIITEQKRAHETYRQLKHGDVIHFQGKRFTVNPAPNHNIRLIEV